jgi:hypothetical protein
MDATQYGQFAPLVGHAGTLIATASALRLAWKRRAPWEPSEEDIPLGAQRVGGLLSALAIGVIWATLRSHAHTYLLVKMVIAFSLGTLVCLVSYGYLVSRHTFERTLGRADGQIKTQKIIGGFALTEASRRTVRQRKKQGQYLNEQELLEGAAHDAAKVWSPASRALAKQAFVLAYIGLTGSGTIALACTAMLVQLSV